MSGRLLLDIRNVYDPKEATRIGFVYEGMGRSGAVGKDAVDDMSKTFTAAELVAD
jgi:hypothetical protein